MTGYAEDEIHLAAGDAVLFVDCPMHGSATPTNPGECRLAVFRYGSSWGVSRRGYEPPEELLERLSEEQAEIVKTWGSVEPGSPPIDDRWGSVLPVHRWFADPANAGTGRRPTLSEQVPRCSFVAL